MPYYVVEGFQHGRPSDPLYIHADSEESAKAKARELGMVVTGVRRSKELVHESGARGSTISLQVYLFCVVSLPIFFLLIVVFGIGAQDPGTMAVMVPLMIVSSNFAIAFRLIHTMIRQQSKTIEMLATEVKDLRCIVDQQKSVPPVQL